MLRVVAFKENNYCFKKREKGATLWTPLDPQPSDDKIVTLSRYYATNKTMPGFKKRFRISLEKLKCHLVMPLFMSIKVPIPNKQFHMETIKTLIRCT